MVKVTPRVLLTLSTLRKSNVKKFDFVLSSSSHLPPAIGPIGTFYTLNDCYTIVKCFLFWFRAVCKLQPQTFITSSF